MNVDYHALQCFLYSPGGSIANLHFMWQVPDGLPIKAACFQNSRPTIEMVRVLLPTFHMRAMSRVIFHKFGQITSDVKPFCSEVFLQGNNRYSHFMYIKPFIYVY